MKLGKDYMCDGQMDIFDFLNPKVESQNQTTHKIAKCLNTEVKDLTVYPASKHIKELFKGNAYYCSQDDKETYMSVLSRCKADRNKITNSMKYCYYEIDEELYCCNYTKYENVTNTTSEKGIIVNKTREKCLFNKENTCTIDGASEIAKSDGYNCNGKCCRGCIEDCGGRCINSERPKEKFCFDDDINEIVKRLDELITRYSNATCGEKKWEVWDHVPNFGFRLTYEVRYKNNLDEMFYTELDKVIAYAKGKNIELSPCGAEFSINGESHIDIFSTYNDKQRRKRKK